MCVLPDSLLLERGSELIQPFDPSCVQPTSIEVHLGDTLGLPGPGSRWPLDVRSMRPDRYTRTRLASDGYVLYPAQRVLGTTQERITIPNDLTMRFEGVSTIGRCFILVHVTAGHFEAGFSGEGTLEIVNLMDDTPFLLVPGMRIGQLVFETLAGPVLRPYGHPELGSRYQGQRGPTSPIARKN